MSCSLYVTESPEVESVWEGRAALPKLPPQWNTKRANAFDGHWGFGAPSPSRISVTAYQGSVPESSSHRCHQAPAAPNEAPWSPAPLSDISWALSGQVLHGPEMKRVRPSKSAKNILAKDTSLSSRAIYPEQPKLVKRIDFHALSLDVWRQELIKPHLLIDLFKNCFFTIHFMSGTLLGSEEPKMICTFFLKGSEIIRDTDFSMTRIELISKASFIL